MRRFDVLLCLLLLAACAPYLSLPKLAKEDATVIVRCSDTASGTGQHSSQLIIVLLDHNKNLNEDEVVHKRRLQKIAEIEVNSDCHFTVRAPKTPIELTTEP